MNCPKSVALFYVIFLCAHISFGQLTTTQAFPTGEQEITIIFDLKLAKDSRAKGLLGKTDDVYLWSGAGTIDNGSAFEYQPTGQTDFSKPFEAGKMTALGNDRWSIKITARTYFKVPANQPIKKLGLLLKSGDGKAQTEDSILKLYDNSSLIASIFKPTNKAQYVDANQVIKMLGRASQTCNLMFKVDNQLVTSSTSDSLNFDFNVGNQVGTRRMVVFQAQTNTLIASDTSYFTVSPQPNIAPLPANIKDGINYINSTTIVLSLFAPLKKFVHVIGEFNNWQNSPQYLMNRTPDGNRYWLEINNLTPQQEYAFQYLVDGTLVVGDPYCEKILDPNNDKNIPSANYPNLKSYPKGATGIVSVLQTAQTPFNWKITNFKRPDADKLTIYELHVRDFSTTRNYKSVIDSLPYLKKLGINTLELMPIMEFTNNDSWGYNPIYFQAPDKMYGTKNDLKTLIDKCHEIGIAVVLDMVLNHADAEFPYVKMYWDSTLPAANSPFFNQSATHPYSVFFDFNHESQATKDLVDNVCKFWIQEYKFDGFRFDLSKGFTQTKSGENVALWSSYDASRVAIWKRIYDKIRGYDPTAYVILEHFADNEEETELSNYGMMLWGNGNGDYRTATAGNLKNIDWISSQKRGWKNRNLVGYIESHDEQRLVYDLTQVGLSQGNYNIKSLPTALERAQLAAVFMLGIPGPKMIWQFGELGYDISIDQNGRTGAKPVKWEYTSDANRIKLLRVYQEMIKLRANSATDYDTDLNGYLKRITITNQSYTTFIIGNFDVRISSSTFNFPFVGKWYDYFTGKENTITSSALPITLQPGEFHVFTSIKLPAPESGIVPWNGELTNVTATDPTIEEEPLIVYPNPTNGQLSIAWNSSETGIVSMEISELNGKTLAYKQVLKNQQKWQESWQVPTQAEGEYLIRISTSKQVFYKRLKVIR